MDEPFLPWWMVLLLGMWAFALTVWRHPSVHREIRLWAGLMTVVYFGLIFLALGFIPSVIARSQALAAHLRIINVGKILCALVSLTCAVWMSGRISSRGRVTCYLVMTVSNAAFCAFAQQQEVAIALLIVAVILAWQPVVGWLRAPNRSSFKWITELTQFIDEPVPVEKAGVSWLLGGLSFVLACVLVGSLAFAVRVESTRSILSLRGSAIPSPERLDLLMNPVASGSTSKPELLYFAFGQRADLVVLLAMILFLKLAVSLRTESRPPVISLFESKSGPLIENNSSEELA